ncbi:WCX domain-containing protein [Marinisporobacter balticus]|uniref:WYL domain-containing protein n=1 Tax=Marinisporobacter balticus TaxID=2018667 RepID=A0A4R2K4J5_9FIRM|nr:WYL domain-containing protein [Marinisporobacter balticus]TCO68093.1 WYL domain-containing protein [Marinisporobacter balticus]
MKIDRLLGILNVLANTDRTTIQKLAERFEVVLEYDVTNEFLLTDKIDAKFFHRISSTEEKGQILFAVSDLAWATNLVFSLQDKVKVIAPLELKEAVKTRIKRINALYKDDI